MPQHFDEDSQLRIDRVVPFAERNLLHDARGGGMDYVGEQPLKWLVLTQGLAAASLGVRRRQPLRVRPTGTPPPTAAAGGYTIDTETTLMVIEATGQRWYGEGAWVLCRPLGNMNVGVLWEPITRGGRFYATVQTNNATSPFAAYANFTAVETRDGLVFAHATSVPLMAVGGGAAWQQNFPSLPSIVSGTEDSRAGAEWRFSRATWWRWIMTGSAPW